MALFALALAHWHHPLSIHGAVHARQLLADGVIHAYPVHLPQGLVLAARHRFGEGRKAHHCGGACFVINPDRQKRHTGADVLKSQVEAFPRKVLHHPSLRVDPQLVLAGDLVGSDGSHFLELTLAEGGAHVHVGLGSEEVEGFLTGHGRAVEGVAVAYNELELHEDAGG